MLDLKIKDVRMSVSKDGDDQIKISFKHGALVIDIVNEEVVSEFVDIEIVNAFMKELVSKEKVELRPLTPIIISYKGEPLAEIYQDGTKKLHPASSAKLGLKLLIHNMVKSL
jgi:hypothetical protein